MEKLETAKAAAVATKASYTASGGLAFLSFYTLDQWALIVAIVIGVLTFVANLIFKVREDRRGKRLLEIHEHHLRVGRNQDLSKVRSEDIDVV